MTAGETLNDQCLSTDDQFNLLDNTLVRLQMNSLASSMAEFVDLQYAATEKFLKKIKEIEGRLSMLERGVLKAEEDISRIWRVANLREAEEGWENQGS